jgi:protein TonB
MTSFSKDVIFGFQKIFAMKTLIILILISIDVYCQNGSINCDSIIFKEDRGCVYYEKMPELIGGLDSLQSRLVYPQEAIENKIEGKVYVIVVVDSLGNQLCARVIKSLGYGCDEESLRLIRTSKFLPGIHRGNPYTMPLSIPIIFLLKDK